MFGTDGAVARRSSMCESPLSTLSESMGICSPGRYPKDARGNRDAQDERHNESSGNDARRAQEFQWKCSMSLLIREGRMPRLSRVHTGQAAVHESGRV